MADRLKISIKLVLILLCTVNTGTEAQILNDPSSLRIIKTGISDIYNFRFAEAKQELRLVHQQYPEHPVGYLLEGFLTYWENYPILPSSPAREVLEKDLRTCINLCEKETPAKNEEAEYLLADLSARGLLLMFYSDNDLSLDIFPLATGTYPYIRKAFGFTSSYNDFYYFTGLFDYYREAFPEAYPVYEPLAMFFPRGDKAKGLRELRKAADSSIFLRAESLSVLSDIYISFENNYNEATWYSKTLYELYPGNYEYKDEYIKNLLLVKQYDDAEKLINAEDSTATGRFFRAQMTILAGILTEKKYHNMQQARKLYTKGISELAPFGLYSNEFSAYAYFGLSRISGAEGDRHHKRLYRRLANKMADFKKVNFDG
ncbi:MAG: hypothetical protein WCE64_16800 [Bacteroidales bacterium]